MSHTHTQPVELVSTKATEEISYWQDIDQREAGTAGQVAVSGLYDLF